MEDPAGGVGLTCPAVDRGSQSSPFAFMDGCVKLLCGARVEPGARPSTEALGAPRLRPTEGAKAVTASKRPHIAGGSAGPLCRGSWWVLFFLRAPAEPPAPSCPPALLRPTPLCSLRPAHSHSLQSDLLGEGRAGWVEPRGTLVAEDSGEPPGPSAVAAGWGLPCDLVPHPQRCPPVTV